MRATTFKFDSRRTPLVGLSEPAKGRIGTVLLAATGLSLVTLHVIHAVQERESVLSFLSGIFIPLSFGVAVLVGGVWLRRRGTDGGYLLRVAGWCLCGAVAFVGEAALMTVYQQTEGVNMSHEFYVVVNTASGGALVGFVLGVYDARQRAARDESDRLNQQLTVINRVLRHDIRNVANIIRGQAALLAEDQTDVLDRAREIRRQSVEMAELGDHAKQLERLLQDDVQETETVDLVSLVETTVERVIEEYPDAVVDVSLPERALVDAHPLVDTALWNVIENGVEHSDERPPRVAVEAVAVPDADPERVELRVADNGPGIPADELAVLERGYETPLEHTSGLGLWLVNWIVRESGGAVSFETNDPDGSVVRLRFQRARPTAPSESPSGVRDGASPVSVE